MPPAARLTDMHTCPMVTPGVPPIPHVGGPILPPCAPTVLINFLPAARVTDMALCVGPPDVIVKGSAGVFINFLPAARMGDQTAHGGVIVVGSPNCIIGEIGSPSPGGAGLAGIIAGLVLAALHTPSKPSATILAPCGKTLHNLPSRAKTRAFQHNADGSIVATKVGGPRLGGHGGAPGEKFILQRYDLTLLDGTKLPAFTSSGRLDPVTGQVVPDPRMGTDCHGVTFTNGEYWINDGEVDSLLTHGGYQRVSAPKPGDVLVYRNARTGNVVHSVTVTDVDRNGKVTQVSGLGGLETAEHYDTPETGWLDPKTIEYWSHP